MKPSATNLIMALLLSYNAELGYNSNWRIIVSISFTKDEDSSGVYINSVVKAFQLISSLGTATLRILRDAVELEAITYDFTVSSTLQLSVILVDTPSADTYTYKIQMRRDSGDDVAVLTGEGDLSVQEFKK